MNICILGTGTAGWISAFLLSDLENANITIIGSPSIPTIGVGESTTLPFFDFINFISKDNVDHLKFLKDTDASMKYGVNYEGWSHNKKRFLNGFGGGIKGSFTLESSYLLGNLDSNVDFNLLYPLANYVYNNTVCVDFNIQPFTYQFDANKLANCLQERSKDYDNITFLKETVVDSVFEGDNLKYLILSNGEKVFADYFVNCIGQTAFNQKIFKDEYISYSDILLTDKALFLPLNYKNKKEEFTPYTTARTMSSGWRWITPTYSRIGTGYVFSSRHISEGEAIDELRKNIGDSLIEPNKVDFYPRRVKKVFKSNYCTVGMAAGFLEPLDAPGITSIFFTLNLLKENLPKMVQTYFNTDQINQHCQDSYNYWCSFILHQYKTSVRDDSKFWIDQKNVKFDYYDNIIDSYFIKGNNFNYIYDEPYLFFNTSAGKGLKWKVSDNLINEEPKLNFFTSTTNIKDKLINHLDYFDILHQTL